MINDVILFFEGLHYFSESSLNLKLFFTYHPAQSDFAIIEIIGYDVMTWNEVPRFYCSLSQISNSKSAFDDERKQVITHALLKGLTLKEYAHDDSKEKSYQFYLKKTDEKESFNGTILNECTKPENIQAFQLESIHHHIAKPSTDARKDLLRASKNSRLVHLTLKNLTPKFSLLRSDSMDLDLSPISTTNSAAMSPKFDQFSPKSVRSSQQVRPLSPRFSERSVHKLLDRAQSILKIKYSKARVRWMKAIHRVLFANSLSKTLERLNKLSIAGDNNSDNGGNIENSISSVSNQPIYDAHKYVLFNTGTKLPSYSVVDTTDNNRVTTAENSISTETTDNTSTDTIDTSTSIEMNHTSTSPPSKMSSRLKGNIESSKLLVSPLSAENLNDCGTIATVPALPLEGTNYLLPAVTCHRDSRRDSNDSLQTVELHPVGRGVIPSLSSQHHNTNGINGTNILKSESLDVGYNSQAVGYNSLKMSPRVTVLPELKHSYSVPTGIVHDRNERNTMGYNQYTISNGINNNNSINTSTMPPQPSAYNIMNKLNSLTNTSNTHFSASVGSPNNNLHINNNNSIISDNSRNSNNSHNNGYISSNNSVQSNTSAKSTISKSQLTMEREYRLPNIKSSFVANEYNTNYVKLASKQFSQRDLLSIVSNPNSSGMSVSSDNTDNLLDEDWKVANIGTLNTAATAIKGVVEHIPDWERD